MLTDYNKLKVHIQNWVHDETYMYSDFSKKEVIGVHLSASSLVRKFFTVNRIKNIISREGLDLKVFEEPSMEHSDRFIISRKQTIAVWFSCGAASAIAAKKTIEKYKDDNILVVNNPVDEEDEDNKRFLKDIEKWLGKEIIIAKNSKIGTTSAVDVWDKRKYMSGVKGAPCTVELKKEARHEFELTHKIDWHVLGFTVDEKARSDRFMKYERQNVIPILIEQGLSKQDCFNIIQDAGIKLPRVYTEFGYPNANCIGCVKSSSPTYWNLVRKNHPNVFKSRAEQSRRIGCKLVKVKGKRIFLDELKETDSGGKIKSWECGIFCETKKIMLRTDRFVISKK